jgi:hypothetical protein
MPGPFRDLPVNLLAGLRLALFLPIRADSFRATGAAFVALALFNCAVWFAADFAHVGAPGLIEWSALESYLAQMALVLLAAFAIGAMQAARDAGLRLAVMWLAPVWVFEVAVTAFVLAASRFAGGAETEAWIDNLPAWLPSADQLYGIWLLAVAVRAVALVVPWRQWRYVAAAGVACALVLILNTLVARPALWRELPAPPVVRAPGIEQEAAFHAQATLLDRTLAAIPPGRPGVIDLYFLGVAAYGAQDVFLREARSVRALFDERFDTEGRSALLVNNNATLTEAPIATLTNLRATLRAFGERMNRDEDVLFLFLTTHGDEQHRLEVELWPLALAPITPQALADAVRESGIRWKVLVISACYAGGFVEALKDAGTLVITAADARSTSFGCAHENDWTHFGEAYFNAGLRKTRSFIEAFELARASVAARERAERLTASNPQMQLGEGMRQRLSALEARLSTQQ